MQPVGKTLWEKESLKNFDLIITDGTERCLVPCHKIILQTASPFFDKELNSKNFFFYVWNVPPNYVNTARNLVKYFYTNDILDLGTQNNNLQKLTLKLEIPALFAKVARNQLGKICRADQKRSNKRRKNHCLKKIYSLRSQKPMQLRRIIRAVTKK
jgi:hypothetical protein